MQARIIISDHLKKEKDKDKENDKEINLNNKNTIGVKNSKQIKPFSSFQLTVITGKNIANRNNENSELNLQNSDSQIQDKEEEIEMKISGDEMVENNHENEDKDMNDDDSSNNSDGDNDYNENDENDDELTYPSTTSKAYTLTEEVQRVLIEDFYPPISSSTVPGNSGRLYISLLSSSSLPFSSSTSSSSPSSFSSSASTPLHSSPINRDVKVNVDVGDYDGDGEKTNGEESE